MRNYLAVLGLLYKQSQQHMSPFVCQNVVCAAGRWRVHRLETNALNHQLGIPSRWGKAKFLATAKQHDLRRSVGHRFECSGVQMREVSHVPRPDPAF